MITFDENKEIMPEGAENEIEVGVAEEGTPVGEILDAADTAEEVKEEIKEAIENAFIDIDRLTKEAKATGQLQNKSTLCNLYIADR